MMCSWFEHRWEMLQIAGPLALYGGSLAAWRTTSPIAGMVISDDRPLVPILLYVMVVWEVFIGTGLAVDIFTVPLGSYRAVGVSMTATR